VQPLALSKTAHSTNVVSDNQLMQKKGRFASNFEYEFGGDTNEMIAENAHFVYYTFLVVGDYEEFFFTFASVVCVH
jgi:hypothetical protein